MAMVTAMETKSQRQARDVAGRRLSLLAVLCAGIASPVLAGEWQIEPSIAVTETVTDNVDLSAQKKSDFVTDITPGIRIDGFGGRTRLHFDYQLHEYVYAQNSSRHKRENALNALGEVELIENWFFLEGSGQIAQQSLSAFGGAGSTSANGNLSDNTVETSTYRLSPYVRGSFGSFADYQLRYNRSTNRSRNNSNSAANLAGIGTDISEVLGTLRGSTSYAALGWSLDASSSKYKFRNGRSNDAERLRGVLAWQFDPQFKVLLIGGIEANDFLTVDKTSYTTKGAGFEWSPTERTKVAASREDRFFGPSNSFTFTHRTAGTAWKYVQSKDATTTPTQQGAVGLGTYYDLYFNLFSSDPAFVALSPAAKTAFINAFLNSVQLSPTAQLQGGFLTSGVTLTERREMSFALLGARNTITFAATQGTSSSLTQGAGTGVLTGNAFDSLNEIRQRGASVNWSHQLTPLSTFTGSFSRLKSTGAGTLPLETQERLITLNVVTKLGPNTNRRPGRATEHRRRWHDRAIRRTRWIGTFSHRF